MQQPAAGYSAHAEEVHREGRHVWQEISLSHLAEIKEYVPGIIAVMLMSLAICFSIPSPFALCFLCAARCKGKKAAKGTLVGMCLSILMRLIWGVDPGILEVVIFIALCCLPNSKIFAVRRVYFTLGCALLLAGVPDYALGDSILIIRRLGSVGLGLGSMPAMLRSTALIYKRSGNRTEDDLMCLALPCMMMLCGASRISLFGINVGAGVGFFATVVMAWMTGTQVGAAAGIGVGFALLAGGQPALYLLSMPMAGLLAGCFQRKNRVLCAMALMISTLCMAFLALQKVPMYLVFNCLAGLLPFVLLTDKRLRPWMMKMSKIQWMQPRENAYLKMRMHKWTCAVDGLAKSLPVPEMPEWNIPQDSEAMAEKQCDGCDHLPICWRDQYTNTKNSFEALAGCTEVDLGTINRYFSHCPRISRLPGLMEEVLDKRNAQRQRTMVACYQREMLQTHLQAMSQAVQLISIEGENGSDEEKEWMEMAEEALQKMRFAGKVAYIKKIDGHFSLAVQCQMIALHPAMGEKLARQLGVYLGARLKVMEQNVSRVVMEEEAALAFRLGKASMGAMQTFGGEKPQDNGDAVLMKMLPGSRLLIAISDGMGHGKGAYRESHGTLNMLSSCLEAGYSTEQAMKTVNGAMLSATDGEAFATVDMALIDLWTGEATLHKLGAEGSVLMQGQRFTWLSGAALPLGIMENVLPSHECVLLAEQDKLVMMSDGIVDLFDGQQDLARTLMRYAMEEIQDMADGLLQTALDRSGGVAKDDMTVVCVEIISAHPEDRNRPRLE